jgi:hypothetical protein
MQTVKEKLKIIKLEIQARYSALENEKDQEQKGRIIDEIEFLLKQQKNCLIELGFYIVNLNKKEGSHLKFQ